jgi:hypothetical protein
LAALGLLALCTPHAQSRFQAPLSFDAGSNPVSVAVGDFNRDGIADLAVANNGSDNVSVLLGKGDGTFQPAVNYATGSGPNSVTSADLNGDGIPDLIVANISGQSVSVLLGKGDGTFQQAVDCPAGGPLYSVAVADFNRDGFLDLAATDASNNNVSVLLGNGDGTFRTAVDYPAGDLPVSVAVGDFNRDGIPDLVVTNSIPAGTVSVLLGNGDGSFRPAANYRAGTNPVFVAVGDFNGDSIPDLAVANAGILGDASTMSILLGNGDGTFQAANNRSVGNGNSSVAVADLNGDGVADLVVTNAGNLDSGQGGNVAVLLGKGDGTFQMAQSYAAAVIPKAVAVGDFNGDGKADLAIVNNGGNNVSVLLGKGDGTFPTVPNYSVGKFPVAVAAADLNGDGILDLAVANQGAPVDGEPGTVSILLGNADGTFQPAVNHNAGSACSQVVVGDLNGDGKPDLVVVNSGDANGNSMGSLSVLLGNGDGTFNTSQTFPAGEAPVSVAVADFNGDGIPDLAVADFGVYYAQSGRMSILLGKGDGTFLPAENYAAGLFPAGLAVGDFNRDGIPDLVVAAYDRVAVLLGNGDGTFQPALSNFTGLNPVSVKGGDFNGDGILDLALTNLLSDDVSVLLGNGDGTFQAAVNYAAGPLQVWAVRTIQVRDPLIVRDFNGDGIADLAVVFGGGVRLLLGNGDGTFQTGAISYVAGTLPQGVAVGDFNHDGFPDLVVTNADSNSVSILFNDGN